TCGVKVEDWTLRTPFRISRETMTHVTVVVVEVTDGVATGRGEGCPVAHYGESVDGVMDQIRTMAAALASGEDWDAVHARTPAGSARNAVDCAVWDWRAKRAGKPVSQLLGMDAVAPIETVFTIGLADPDAMARGARKAAAHDILKLKIGGDVTADMARLRAVREAVPDKRLIADVNEGWTLADLETAMPVVAECGLLMLEQPLPAGKDDGLRGTDYPVPIGADESCHTTADLGHVAERYGVINIKLDKTGGLTEAMQLVRGGQERGLDIMIGCMLGTSLAMAPGMIVAQFARFVDLDAPLLIGADRDPALVYENGIIQPPSPALWG
ncbi:MAG: N-acetyl-D-Glu racemase DgcA, partial [Sphingomonadales bacterium]